MSSPATAVLKRNLDRASWAVCAGGTDEPDRDSSWIEIAGPSTAAAALRGAGQWSLDSPARAFDAETWWFRCRFDSVEGDAVLGMGGLATLAHVSLNGERIVESENMFSRHRCDVRQLLRPSGNELLIRCSALTDALATRKPRPLWRAPMVAHQQLRWWRTTLLGRTPGWSPPAAPVGPWRGVWIGPRESVALDSLQLRATINDGTGVVEWSFTPPDGSDAELVLSRGGESWSAPLSRTLQIPNVARWWPSTHGEPAVYEARLRMRTASATFDVPLAPVGFREIDVDTSDGGFRVRVNGVKVFCRGAVWMPLDVVSLRAKADEYERAIAQVRAAGMNMLRVPGTAVYEEDAFYEACDRAGMLVWQDFMFANMDYPRGNEVFDALVAREVRDQLQRLHAHPCLAILCGNSEAEQQAAMWGAPRDAWKQPLFDELLPRLCDEHAPGVAYWPSSAHGGALPQQPSEGSTSYYGVGAYLRPLDDARTSGLKFASECLAFANVPAPATIARVPVGKWKERTSRDLGASWDFEDVRDHYLHRLYGIDPRELRSTDVERYLALARKVTGDVMAHSFAQWRRGDSECGGALVLMLRDLWAGAGWGLVDDQGTPKSCLHVLKRVLQPLAVTITDEGMNGLHAHVLNDTSQSRSLELRMRAWRDGEVQVADARATVDVSPHDTRTIPLASLLDHFMDLNWSHHFGPPPCDVVECALHDESGAVIARARHVLYSRFVHSRDELGLRATSRRIGENEWEVALTSKRFAWGAHFDWEGLVADDDWLDLSPGDEVRVILRGSPARYASATVRALNAREPSPITEDRA